MLFDFKIRRNITVIKGDSATGKTTLLHMLYEYLRTGRESGYSVSADVEYFVYLRKEVGRDWQKTLSPLKSTVIFIEENNDFVFSKKLGKVFHTAAHHTDLRKNVQICKEFSESLLCPGAESGEDAERLP